MARGVEERRALRKASIAACSKFTPKKLQKTIRNIRQFAPQNKADKLDAEPSNSDASGCSPFSETLNQSDTTSDPLSAAKRTLDSLAASGQVFGIYTIDQSVFQDGEAMEFSDDLDSKPQGLRITSQRPTAPTIPRSQPRLPQLQPARGPNDRRPCGGDAIKRPIDEVETSSVEGSEESDDGRESEDQIMKSFMIGDTNKLEQFYNRTFFQVQQLGMKSVLKAWIKEIEPKKSRRFPYCQAEQGQPDWWPKDVVHKEPDHLKKEPRHKLARTILRYAMDERFEGQGIDRLEKSTLTIKLHFDKEPVSRLEMRKNLLEQLYETARKEQELRNDERDSDDMVCLRHSLTVSAEGRKPKKRRRRRGRDADNTFQLVQYNIGENDDQFLQHQDASIDQQLLLKEQPLNLCPREEISVGMHANFQMPCGPSVPTHHQEVDAKPQFNLDNDDPFVAMSLSRSFSNLGAFANNPYDTVPSTPTLDSGFPPHQQMSGFQGGNAFSHLSQFVPSGPAMHGSMGWSMDPTTAMSPSSPTPNTSFNSMANAPTTNFAAALYGSVPMQPMGVPQVAQQMQGLHFMPPASAVGNAFYDNRPAGTSSQPSWEQAAPLYPAGSHAFRQ